MPADPKSESATVNLGYNQSTDSYSAQDRKYLWHPFTHLPTWLDDKHPVRTIVRGKGAFLFDADDKKLHDANASIWSNIHGHAHPHLTAAITEQARRFAHSSFLGFSHPPGIEYGRRLIDDYLGKFGLNRIFYAESGANAIEAALRMALQWQRISGKPERTRIINFRQSYHGDTLGALAVTGLAHFNHHSPDWGYEVVTLDCIDQLDHIEAPETVAAIIFEPLITGAAGMHPWPEGMIKQSRQWCDQHDALLILDEVFTGFGRTGTMFAFENESIAPDLLVLGKAITSGTIPLSAVVTRDRIFHPFSTVGKVEDSLLTGHTYAANPTACAAAIASLDLIEKNDTLSNVRARSQQLSEFLPKLQALPKVKETRQLGLAAAIELHDPEHSDHAEYGAKIGVHAAREAYKHGVLIRNIGPSLILCPQLSITKEALTDLLEKLQHSLQTQPAETT